MSVSALERGATIGILGSGQLGRMLALAAARLGFKCHIFAPDRESPAFDVVPESTCADYADEQALARFAESVDVVTFQAQWDGNHPSRFQKSAFKWWAMNIAYNGKMLLYGMRKGGMRKFVESMENRTQVD